MCFVCVYIYICVCVCVCIHKLTLLTVLHFCYVRCMSAGSLLLKILSIIRSEVFMAGRTKLHSSSLKMQVPVSIGKVFTKVYGAVFSSDHKTPSSSSRDCVWLNLGLIFCLTNDRTKAGPNSHYAIKHIFACRPRSDAAFQIDVASSSPCGRRVESLAVYGSEFSDQKLY